MMVSDGTIFFFVYIHDYQVKINIISTEYHHDNPDYVDIVDTVVSYT